MRFTALGGIYLAIPTPHRRPKTVLITRSLKIVTTYVITRVDNHLRVIFTTDCVTACARNCGIPRARSRTRGAAKKPWCGRPFRKMGRNCPADCSGPLTPVVTRFFPPFPAERFPARWNLRFGSSLRKIGRIQVDEFASEVNNSAPPQRQLNLPGRTGAAPLRRPLKNWSDRAPEGQPS